MPGKILVQRISPPSISEFGILLPNTSPTGETLMRGTVLAAGDPDKSEVREGDTVVFPYRAGEEFKVDGQAVLLMPETMIRAIETPVA